MGKKITLKEIKCKLPAFVSIIDSTYVSAAKKATFIDIEYGEFSSIVSEVIKFQKGHPKRSLKKRAGSHLLSEDYINSKLRHGCKIVFATFTKTKNKATFIDPDYGSWEATPEKVMSGSNHPRRSIDGRMIAPEEVQNKLPTELTLEKETYKNMTTKAKFIDMDFGDWWVKPANVIFLSQRHPKRAKLSRAKKLTYSIKDAQEKMPGFVTIMSETYIDAHTECTMIDEKYGSFQSTPANVIYRQSGHPQRGLDRKSNLLSNGICVTVYAESFGAPNCTANHIYRSYGAETAKEWIEKYKTNLSSAEVAFSRLFNMSNISCERWNKSAGVIRVSKPYRPDYKLTYNGKVIYVDVDGLLYHSDSVMSDCDREYHFEKRVKYEQKSLILIQIRQDEVQFSPDIVKSIIEAKFNTLNNKHYARNLQIKSVSGVEAKTFLKANHLMGEFKPAKHIGLFKDQELLSMISYKKHKNGIDISRFCNKINNSVAGGLSRLLKHIERIESPTFIQSSVDLRYGNGDSLLKVGFELKRVTMGWSWTDGISTFNRRKCVANMDERGLTEKEYASELKWYKIYDAGQAKFIKIINKSA